MNPRDPGDARSRELGGIGHEIGAFLKRHWIQGLLLVPGAFAVTVVHETAHAVAVMVSGGEVTQFVVVPGGREWGHVAYRFPAGVVPLPRWIALAPYLLWVFLSLWVLVLSRRPRPVSRSFAPFLWIWLYVVPLADVANAAFPYLLGGDNDFRTAFGAPGIPVCFGIGFVGLLTCLAEYLVQRRLYRDDALSVAAYGVLVAIVGLLMLGVSSMSRGG